MKRILVIDNSPRVTGAFKSIIGVIHKIKEFDFFFCIPDHSSTTEELKQLNFPYVTRPFIEIQKSLKIIFYLPVLLLNSMYILRYAKNNNIQVIHVNDLYNMCGVLVKIFSPSIQLIYHVRLLPSSYAKCLYPVWRSLIVKYADQIICVSNAVWKGWPVSNRIHMIYDAMDANETLIASQNFSTEKTRFLYLANYIPGKGQQYAIEAFKRAYAKIEKPELIFAGSDMGLKSNQIFKEILLHQVESLGISDHIIFKDFVEDIETEIKRADVFLNFSESESFSMTCLEGLYFGTPCIASDSGGPSEIIEHGVSGLIVPNKDVQAMADAMVKLAEQPALRKEFSDAGRVRARTVFNIQQQSEKLRNVYLGL